MIRIIIPLVFGLISISAILPGIAGAVEKTDLLSDADAYYDYKIRQCEIKGDKAEIHTKEKITVLNARGLDYNSFFEQEGRYNKIKRLKVRLLDADGKIVIEDDKDDLEKACGFGDDFQIYTDICTYFKEYKYPTYPFSLEYEYDMEISSLFFWRGERFQHYIPVLKASYQLICPSEFDFNFKVYGLEIEPAIEKRGDESIYLWEAENIPALEDIDYEPDGYPVIGRISLIAVNFKMGGSQFDGQSWKSVGDWHRQLSEDYYLTADSVYWFMRRSSDAITGDSLISEIYRECRDKTRYVSVSIGIGGWRPHHAELTKSRGYGDCKDMSTLLISYLRLMEIESYPVLALTRGNGKTDLDFPGFDFNHVFVMAVNKDTIWMDPTCDFCPFSDLPLGDENIPVVVITDTGGVVVNTPGSTDDDNRIIKDGRIFIDKEGKVSLKVDIAYYGNYSPSCKEKIRLLDEDETKIYITGLLPGGGKRFRLIDYDIKNTGSADLPLEINIDAVMKKQIDEIGNILYFDPNIFETLNKYESLDLENRHIPVNWSFPFLRSDRYVIRWDSSYVFDSVYVPPTDSNQFDFGRIGYDYRYCGDSVVVNLHRSFNDYILPVEQFDNFEEYREIVKDVASRYIKFYKKAL